MNPIGRTIVDVRWLTDDENDMLWWDRNDGYALVLDNGALLIPSRDEEGNRAGVLFGTHDLSYEEGCEYIFPERS